MASSDRFLENYKGQPLDVKNVGNQWILSYDSTSITLKSHNELDVFLRKMVAYTEGNNIRLRFTPSGSRELFKDLKREYVIEYYQTHDPEKMGVAMETFDKIYPEKIVA